MITGKWEGKYSEAGEAPGHHYGFIVKPGNSLERTDPIGLVQGTGEWELQGNEFRAWYNMGKERYRFSVHGNYCEASGKITGTWGTGTNNRNGGDFYLEQSRPPEKFFMKG